MTATVVTTQAQLDAALADPAICDIEIRSERGVWLTMGDTGDSHVVVAGETTIRECSGSVGRVTDSGRVDWVTGSGRVDWVTGSGRVDWVTDSGSVGRVTGSGSVGRVTGSGSVDWVTGSGRVDWVTGSGSVGRVTDSGSVERAAGTATVHLYGNARLHKASPHVAVFLHSGRATVEGGHLIELTDVDLTDARTWCDHHGVDLDDERAVLYKAVRDDWRSAHGTSYQPGTTASCDDFEADGECGHGLHVSPTPRQAAIYDYESTRYVEVRVPLAGISVIGPDKCKAASVECVREVDVHGEPIATPAADDDAATDGERDQLAEGLVAR